MVERVGSPRRPSASRLPGEESDEENYAKGQKTPPPAGTQHFKLDDEDSVPELGGTLPDRLVDVRPQMGARRHGGIGYELVLSTAVPLLDPQEAEHAVSAFLRAVNEVEEEKEKEKDQDQEQDEAGEGPGNS